MAYQNQYKCRTEEAITHFIELKKSKEIIFRNRKWASIKTCCEFYDLNEVLSRPICGIENAHHRKRLNGQ